MHIDQQSVAPQPGKPPPTKVRQAQALASTRPLHHDTCSLPSVLLGLTGVALLVMGIMAARSFSPLFPSLPTSSGSVSARVVSYVEHGFWKADLRTLVALVEYLASPTGSPCALPLTNPPVANPPVAYTPAPTAPKS